MSKRVCISEQISSVMFLIKQKESHYYTKAWFELVLNDVSMTLTIAPIGNLLIQVPVSFWSFCLP